MRNPNRLSEYKFRAYASKIVPVILVLCISIPMAQRFLRATPASANPNKCPPGIAECKWVQHQNTGKCQYLPEKAVAWPWKEIPENSCPSLATATLPAPPVVKTVKPDPTLVVIVPTFTYAPTEVSVPIATCTPTVKPDPKPDPKPDAEKVTVKGTTKTVTVTATPACDICEQLRRMADLMSAKATMESK